MSPSPIKRLLQGWQGGPRLSVAIGADAIGIAGTGSSQSPIQVTLPLAPLTDNRDWQAVLQPLGDWLDQTQLRNVSITIQLSNRYARYALMPWSSEVQGGEEQALALACLEAQYGDMTGWTPRLDPGAYGEARLVCAIEAALLDALRTVLEPRGIRCPLIQPYFAVCWNRWRNELRKGGTADLCFAVAEGGMLVMATCQQGRWHSVRAVGCRDLDLVPSLAERESLLQGFAQTLPAYLHSPGLDAERRKLWSERSHVLDTSSINATPALATAMLGMAR